MSQETPAGELTESDLLTHAVAAGLLPNTIHAWMPALTRYTSAIIAAPQPQQIAEPASQALVLDTHRRNGLAWAVAKWEGEVKNRPLVNVHRRSLDDTWRQVVRYFEGDPDALLGPSHDDLVSFNTPKEPS